MSEKLPVKPYINKRKKHSRITSVGTGDGVYDASMNEIEKEAQRLASMSKEQLTGNLTTKPKIPDFVAPAIGKKHSSEEKLYNYRLKEFTNLRRKVWTEITRNGNELGWNTNPILVDFFKKHNLIDTWLDFPPTFNHEKVKNMLLDNKKYSFVMNELIKINPSYSLEVPKRIKKHVAEELKRDSLRIRKSTLNVAKSKLLNLIKALGVGDVFRKPLRAIYDENGIKGYEVPQAVILDDKKYDKLLWSFYVMSNRVKEIAKQRRWFGR
jgi:hypothetical protein